MESTGSAPSPPFLTVPEAARYLGVARRTLYELLERGELVAVRIGRATAVEKRSLDRFKEGGRLT